MPTRVFVFNCTHGRNGTSFLSTVFAKTDAQLHLHGESTLNARSLFDHVVFCSNVTYADGGWKGGA